MTDSISDMLNRIRTGQSVGRQEIEIPFSNIKMAVAELLEKEEFVLKAEKISRKAKKFIKITLKYSEKGGLKKIAYITGLKRVSKPGQRIYAAANELKKVKNGYGVSIISTSAGLFTGEEARKRKIGGEVLCEIW